MKTSRPFATISYNTKSFLHNKLKDLYQRDIISFYAFINHEREEDEEKEHIHVFFIPNGSVNTDAIRKEFEEYDPLNPTLPLRCLPFKSSRFDDWYLYGLHDHTYLASKGQFRKYHYLRSDFIVSDELYFSDLIGQINYNQLNRIENIKQFAQSGIEFVDILASGLIPIQQLNQWEKFYDYIQDATFRNGRSNHEDYNNNNNSGTNALPKGDNKRM